MTFPFYDSLIPLSEEAVETYCRTAHRHDMSGLGPTGPVLLNSRTAVKFGMSVFVEEFNNQEYAHRHVDPAIVYVPKPLRFFQRGLYGFVVMEWLDLTAVGRDPDDITAVARAVHHVHSIMAPKGTSVGPAGGGSCRGDRFNEDLLLRDKTDLQNFLNNRLRNHRWSYDDDCSV